MTLKIGITGGIGSGKSFIATIFKRLGVPFYDADYHAKLLMMQDESIRSGLIEAFGRDAYRADGTLNRPFLANTVFGNQQQLERMNAIVHPRVIAHAEAWAEAQHSPYSLKEAALLFESGSYKKLDFTILVTAPQELRIQRVMLRDQVDALQVQQRIDKQMPDDEKKMMADFTIVNDGQTPLLPQVLTLHTFFLHTYNDRHITRFSG